MDTPGHLLTIAFEVFLNSKRTDAKTTNQITTQPIQKHLTCRLLFLGPISMQVQHEIGNVFASSSSFFIARFSVRVAGAVAQD